MLFTLALVTAIVGFVSANPLQTDTVPGNCGDPRNALPLLTAYSATQTDHFYTTSVTEHQHAIATLGFTDQVGTSGYIFSSQEPHTVPLYRMYSSSISDHFYTIIQVERAFAIQVVGYADEGIAGYVYADAACGAVPVYSLWSVNVSDHYYTVSDAERDNAINNLTYKQGGSGAFYMLPF